MVSPQADQPRVKRARRNALRPNSEEIDLIREIGVTYRLSQIEVRNTEVSENNTSEREEVSRETRNNSTNIVNNERLPLPPIQSTSATIISAPMPGINYSLIEYTVKILLLFSFSKHSRQ